MTTDTDRVLERVRKMFALANDKGATEGERDNAMRMAHATLAKYNLDMSALEKTGKRKEEERIMHGVQFFGRPWARIAAQAIASLMFCEYLYMEATKAKDTTHLFVGKESNAKTAAEMAKWIVDSIMREGKRRQRECMAGNIFYRSFATGAASKVYARVAELRKKNDNLEQSAPGSALVLASFYETEHAANKALIELRVPRTRKGRNGSAELSYGATLQGQAYGASLNLDRQIGSDAKPNPRLR